MIRSDKLYLEMMVCSHIPSFPLHGCLSTSFSIMSFQFVTGCYFSDKNKYYWKGGGWVVVVGVISYFYWTITSPWTNILPTRSVWFPLNNRTFQRQNIADCANISQEISVTISGLNTEWPWSWILMAWWCDNIRCHTLQPRYANTWCLFICFYLCRITR